MRICIERSRKSDPRLKLFLMHSHIISSHGARHYMRMRIPSLLPVWCGRFRRRFFCFALSRMRRGEGPGKLTAKLGAYCYLRLM